jgi:molybdopterin-guanine dinucleotide biosynthesis protein A
LKAAVLAGGLAGKLVPTAEATYKALVPVADRPMVGYVVEALGAAQQIGEVIVVSGPQGLLPASAIGDARQATAASTTFGDTVAAAARAAGNGLLLLATADIPLLTPEAADDTVAFALDSGADLTYTIADVEGVLAAFPGTTRTSVRLQEGRFTGGNLVVAQADSLLQGMAAIQNAFGRRKSILGLALLLGPLFVLRLALGRLTVEAAAARGSEILGCSVAVHLSRYPEVAFDVDKPSDLAAAEAALNKRLA